MYTCVYNTFLVVKCVCSELGVDCYYSLRSIIIGKPRVLSREVTCHFRIYLKIGRPSVKPSWKHCILMRNYTHTSTL